MSDSCLLSTHVHTHAHSHSHRYTKYALVSAYPRTHMHTHTHTHTRKQTNKQTHTHTHTHTQEMFAKAAKILEDGQDLIGNGVGIGRGKLITFTGNLGREVTMGENERCV
jgi:hypothetical protein